MNIRTRKLIGAFGLVAFVAAYSVAVVSIGEYVPNIWWVRMIYFIVAGVSWGVPILPMLKWMNGAPEQN